VFLKENIFYRSGLAQNFNDLILIHPANDAKKELLGCIAPVTFRTGIANGSLSRKALEKLKTLVFPVLERHEEVKLIIKTTL
jgi:hypothetical protein